MEKRMKRIITTIVIALLCGMAIHGENRLVTVNDGPDHKKQVFELRDTIINGKPVTDTLSITTYESNTESAAESSSHVYHESFTGRTFDNWIDRNGGETLVALTAIVFSLGMPLLIVIAVLYFRHKNRKAQYRLVEQALAAGQPLPEDFFRRTDTTDIHAKGIKNICTGAGLCLFLWFLTGKFNVASIGLLIMFTGFGQLIIYYTRPRKKDDQQ